MFYFCDGSCFGPQFPSIVAERPRAGSAGVFEPLELHLCLRLSGPLLGPAAAFCPQPSLDALVMNGTTLEIGAVANLRAVRQVGRPPSAGAAGRAGPACGCVMGDRIA